MAEFCPNILLEEPTPDYLQNCRDCGLYEQGTRMVWGEGYPKAPIMIILDNPGSREDREGDSFLCGTRQTLQEVVNYAGLNIEDLYVTFILKRKPALILCLGNVAVQSFFQNPQAVVKSLRGNWHDVRGFQTAVAYHPLAVRRRPNLRPLFLEDLSFVAEHFHNLSP